MNCHPQKDLVDPENVWVAEWDPVKAKPPVEEQRDITADPAAA
jgi:hypothetical protein